MMRALTVKQPWAWAIIHGGKTIENRRWRTRHRGPLAIHASARDDQTAWTDPRIVNALREANQLYDPALNGGAFIGVVDLVDIVRDHDSRWAEPGAWHWILTNPRPLLAPIVAKGQLGLWTPTGSQRRAITEGARA